MKKIKIRVFIFGLRAQKFVHKSNDGNFLMKAYNGQKETIGLGV